MLVSFLATVFAIIVIVTLFSVVYFVVYRTVEKKFKSLKRKTKQWKNTAMEFQHQNQHLIESLHAIADTVGVDLSSENPIEEIIEAIEERLYTFPKNEEKDAK
jgi:hypothetical protein